MVRKRLIDRQVEPSDEKTLDRLFVSLEPAKGRGTVSRIKVAGIYEEFSSVQFVGGEITVLGSLISRCLVLRTCYFDGI